MGAGSAKGVNEINDEDNDPENDRFSVISGGSPSVDPKFPKSENKANDEVKTNNIRAKMEALGAESEDDDPLSKSADEGERKEDERRRGLFGFSRKKSEDEKTNAFIHENGDETKRSIKRESSKGFRFFKFKKEDKKKLDEKDEKLDQEIKDLQQAFDSLGIVGSNVWNDNSKKDPISSKKSQSADDIRELEPMRNRLNQKRRFSRPANAGGSIRRGHDGMVSTSGGGKRRTFKYSWEKENVIANPVQTEDWNYEAVSITQFLFF